MPIMVRLKNLSVSTYLILVLLSYTTYNIKIMLMSKHSLFGDVYRSNTNWISVNEPLITICCSL